MASDFTITVDASGPIAMLEAAGHDLKPALLEELATTSEMVKEVMKNHAPDAFGNLHDSIGFKIVPELLTSEIKPSADYADAVETGSRPHWVSAKPGSPLEQWALFRGINVYAVQHSIAVKGTKPHPYIQPTYDEVAPTVSDRFALAIAKFIGGLDLAV